MSRKYTPEQLAEEIARPKRKGGRPRKYETEEERKRATAESTRRNYWRKKNAEFFVANDVAFALQKHVYATDAERQEGHRQQSLQYYRAHREEYTLRRAASRRT